MSVGDRIAAAKDEVPSQTAANSGDDRLRNEAFERTKRDAISVAQNGGVNLTPDAYWNILPGQSPWDPRPGDPLTDPLPHPPDLPPPVVGRPPEGDGDGHKPGDGDGHKPGDGDGSKPGGDGGTSNPSPNPNPIQESMASKIGREALVVTGGLGESFFYNLANLPRHLPEIGTSMVIGATLATISKAGGKLGAAAALVVGGYFTSRFILDTINDHKRWDELDDTLHETWKSNDNLLKHINSVSNTLGDYTFDTAIAVGSSYVGYKNPDLAGLIGAVLRIPPILPSTPAPFSPALAATSMYLDFMPPSGFYQQFVQKSFDPNRLRIFDSYDTDQNRRRQDEIEQKQKQSDGRK